MSSRVFKQYQTENIPLQIQTFKLNGKANGTIKPAELEEAYHAGLQKGYQDGYQQGLEQAYQEVQAKTEKTLREAEKRAVAIIEGAEKERISILKSTEPQIAELAIMVARRILGDAFNFDQQLINTVVSEAVSKVSVSICEIKILVSVEDYPWVNEALPELRRDFPHLKKIDLEVRNDLTAGDCVIDSKSGVVDARIDTQLLRLRQALLALD